MAGEKDDREGVEDYYADNVDQKITEGYQAPFETVRRDGVPQIADSEGRSLRGDPLELECCWFGWIDQFERKFGSLRREKKKKKNRFSFRCHCWQGFFFGLVVRLFESSMAFHYWRSETWPVLAKLELWLLLPDPNLFKTKPKNKKKKKTAVLAI